MNPSSKSVVNHRSSSRSSKNCNSIRKEMKLNDRRENEMDENSFCVDRVYHSFVQALKEPSNCQSPIVTQFYIDGYRELIKFVDQLGWIFSFVKDDVREKLTILQRFLDEDQKNGTSHFETIEKSIDYERRKNFIQSNPHNFSRTLLRLHRALLFILQFLRSLTDQPISISTCQIANQVYQSTLAQYHGFLIRNSVRLGFRMLPTREQIDEDIFHGEKSQLIDQYKSFISTLEQIYQIIQSIYEIHQFLQLP